MLLSAARAPNSCNRTAIAQRAPPARSPATAGSVGQMSLCSRLDARARDLGPTLDLVVPALATRQADIPHHQHENDVEHHEREHDGRALERIGDRYRNLAGLLRRAHHG